MKNFKYNFQNKKSSNQVSKTMYEAKSESNTKWYTITSEQLSFVSTLEIGPSKMLAHVTHWCFTTHPKINTFCLQQQEFVETGNLGFSRILFRFRYWLTSSDLSPIFTKDSYLDGICSVEKMTKLFEIFAIDTSLIRKVVARSPEEIQERLTKLDCERRQLLSLMGPQASTNESIIPNPTNTPNNGENVDDEEDPFSDTVPDDEINAIDKVVEELEEGEIPKKSILDFGQNSPNHFANFKRKLEIMEEKQKKKKIKQ